MFNKIRRKLAEIAFAYKMWADRKEIEEEFQQALNFAGLGDRNIGIHDEERQMVDGVIAMKVAVNKMVKNKSAESYNNLLYDLDDLLKLSGSISSKYEESLWDLRKKLTVFREKDVRTKKDKENMIDTRIRHYKELHITKESRALRRQERKARNSGDSELADELLKEWKQKYGK